jgi:UDP-glucose 4-epimerase
LENSKRVLITGAAGFIGQQLLSRLAVDYPYWTLIAADIRPQSLTWVTANVQAVQLDISCEADVLRCVEQCKPHAIVHLASVVTPPPGMTEQKLHDIDVGGTRSIVKAALANDVEQLVVTSSGAAYGYHPDNLEWLDEDQPLRGHQLFAYARHKREVEEMLAELRRTHPQLKQLILRPGTILGARVNNQITELFKKPAVFGIRGCDSPFVFIWDQDVVEVIRLGLFERRAGIFNLAGDGALSMREIAEVLDKPYMALPAALVKGVLALLHPLRLSQYGPEQVDFLRYRPVLSNQRLKSEFGFTPRYTSREVFLTFLKAQGG